MLCLFRDFPIKVYGIYICIFIGDGVNLHRVKQRRTSRNYPGAAIL